MNTELVTELRKLKAPYSWLVCYIALFGVFWLDNLLGAGISTAIFYLIPIFISTVVLTKAHTVWICIFSSLLWLVSDLQELELGNATLIWNTAVRLAVFVLFALLLKKILERSSFFETLASTDGLTNLLNKRGFMEKCSDELARAKRFGRPFSLAFIDLDNFKSVNDKYGHQAGDELLKAVAESLISSARVTDKVGRLGGDEFAILFVETSQEDVKKAFSKCNEALLEKLGLSSCSVTLSAGVLTFEGSDMSLMELIDTADKWMYQVKQAGKNNVIYKMDHELIPVIEL